MKVNLIIIKIIIIIIIIIIITVIIIIIIIIIIIAIIIIINIAQHLLRVTLVVTLERLRHSTTVFIKKLLTFSFVGPSWQN